MCFPIILFSQAKDMVDMLINNIYVILLVVVQSLGVSDSLWPHELQHTRLLCPALSPGFLKFMSIESVMPSNQVIGKYYSYYRLNLLIPSFCKFMLFLCAPWVLSFILFIFWNTDFHSVDILSLLIFVLTLLLWNSKHCSINF